MNNSFRYFPYCLRYFEKSTHKTSVINKFVNDTFYDIYAYFLCDFLPILNFKNLCTMVAIKSKNIPVGLLRSKSNQYFPAIMFLF